MTDEQRKRVHVITYSCEDREELAERIVALEDLVGNLRKAVSEMVTHIKTTCSICDEDFCSSWDEENERCMFESWAREYGVEVKS